MASNKDGERVIGTVRGDHSIGNTIGIHSLKAP